MATVPPFFNQNVARLEKSDPVKLQAVESACTCVQVGCQTVAMTTLQVLCKVASVRNVLLPGN